jgi:octaprenyl-diphosphate synthase
MSLNKIFVPIREELESFDRELKIQLETDSPLIYQLTKHLFTSPGKKLRPTLLFLSSRVLGNDGEEAVFPALALELIHTATLLHDDVIDESESRRGRETVNHRWNNLAAVLLGDYLFAKAFKILVKAGVPELLEIVSKATERVSIGELEQVAELGNTEIEESRYLEVISKKTASLFACAGECGQILAGDNSHNGAIFRDFGENFGIAFQITDDLLDLTGDAKTTGKEVGKDLRSGWITLPVIHALRQSPEKEGLGIVELINNDFKDRDLSLILNFINRYGGLEYARKRAEFFRDEALSSIANLKPSEHKRSLEELANFVVGRKK